MDPALSAQGLDVIKSIYKHLAPDQTPYEYQVNSLVSLWIKRKNTLIVRPTGAGKSRVMHAMVLVMSGVHILLQPLLALGIEQTQRVRDASVHIDGASCTILWHVENYIFVEIH